MLRLFSSSEDIWSLDGTKEVYLYIPEAIRLFNSKIAKWISWTIVCPHYCGEATFAEAADIYCCLKCDVMSYCCIYNILSALKTQTTEVKWKTASEDKLLFS